MKKVWTRKKIQQNFVKKINLHKKGKFLRSWSQKFQIKITKKNNLSNYFLQKSKKTQMKAFKVQIIF